MTKSDDAAEAGPTILERARTTAALWLDVPEFLDRRRRHVQAVGAKAEALAPAFGDDGPVLAASAWLHDIGYAPRLQETGFHPLDGARELERRGVHPRVCGLVANHSGAAVEAGFRDLTPHDERGAVRDALWMCDMTTSPVGEPVDFEERLREISARYGPKHPASRAITVSGDEIRAAIHRTRALAAVHGIEV